MSKIIREYKEFSNLYNSINIPFKLRIKAILTGLIFSVFIISAPFLVLINLYIFYDYRILITFGVALLLFLLFMVFDYFYVKSLKEYNDEYKNINFKKINIVNYPISLTLIMIVTTILCLIIF